ncbi:hypothetical protein ES703_71191 [subsurface metagenome]
MKTLKAQLEVKTQEYEETALNWKKGEETLSKRISQWKEGKGRQHPKGSKTNK